MLRSYRQLLPLADAHVNCLSHNSDLSYKRVLPSRLHKSYLSPLNSISTYSVIRVICSRLYSTSELKPGMQCNRFDTYGDTCTWGERNERKMYLFHHAKCTRLVVNQYRISIVNPCKWEFIRRLSFQNDEQTTLWRWVKMSKCGLQWLVWRPWMDSQQVSWHTP